MKKMKPLWLLALFALVYACAKASATPAPPSLSVILQQATDSTVHVSVALTPPTTGTPPFSYTVTIGSNDAGVVYEDSAKGDSLAYDFDVPRADSVYSIFVCATASNAVGTGPAACNSYNIPPKVVAPGAPGVGVTIDSLIASADSLTLSADSVVIVRSDSTTGFLGYAIAFLRGVRVDSVSGPRYQLTAYLWAGDSIIACSGACDLTTPSASLAYGSIVRLPWSSIADR